MLVKPKDLERIGEALFGPTWQTALAKELKKGSRTVRRWAEIGAPESVIADLRQLCLKRADILLKTAAALGEREIAAMGLSDK